MQRSLLCECDPQQRFRLCGSDLCRSFFPLPTILYSILVFASSAFAVPIQKGPDKKTIFAPDVASAWVKAGAEVGWMSLNIFGEIEFAADPPDRPCWPAFRFLRWEEGVLASLPKPERSFGLDLSSTDFGDKAVTQVPVLQNLSALSLCRTQVSDQSAKDLVFFVLTCGLSMFPSVG